ncbi:uncharacterized protein LOC128199244 [Bicyclus anynana]|uniref:Uncharacterized protein LOC128199244 n=1 Tax=Bicyclus anynana TaxID=110368 RepID=A0ABM3LXU4_BICAN|nr:uncharacterized protein LOC128199244 [Bicyclus anynana]
MNQTQNISVLQTNINHCAGAQDLLLQSIAQWQIDLAVACEPYFVPSQANWVGDTDDLVVVVSANSAGPSLSAVERGPGYAVARWGEYIIVGVYFSPNRPLAEFEAFLDSVSEAVRRHNVGRTLVLGDFNAKSQAWGSPATDARGRAVQVWAVHQGLNLLNRGTTYTCVREEGGSIVDLSFATPLVADRVTGWKVWDWVETLSDHNYIRFKVSAPGVTPIVPSRGSNCFPRWCLSQVDRELAREAAIVQRWSSLTFDGDTSVDTLVNRLHEDLTVVCDSSMPRARRWHRRRRNGLYMVLEEQLREVYRQAKKALQIAIRSSKEQAREELLEDSPAGVPAPGGR